MSDIRRDTAMNEPQNDRGRLIFAVVLIGLGIVVLLMQSGTLPSDFNWWALFIALPGIALLLDGLSGGEKTEGRIGKIGVGIVLLLVASAFLFDPDGTVWNQVEDALPFIRNAQWDQVVGAILAFLGALTLFRAYRDKSSRSIIPGAALFAVGATLLFDSASNLIVPVILVGIGLALIMKRSAA